MAARNNGHQLVTFGVSYDGSNEWEKDAACADQDLVGIFYAETRAHEQFAKSICATCPVVNECLDWALKASNDFGVWGGMTPRERKVEKRRRWRDRHSPSIQAQPSGGLSGRQG